MFHVHDPLTRPMRIPTRWSACSLIIAVMAATAMFTLQAFAEEPATDEHPSAAEVLARHVEAIGGEEAVLRHEHRFLKGTLKMPAQGMEGRLTIHTSAPNRYLLEVELDGIGMLRTGFDGEVAWSLNPMEGPRLLEGDEREEILRDADLRGVLNYDQYYEKMEVAGITDFEGRESYELRLRTESGHEATEYYEVETGLAIGRRAEVETGMGRVPTTQVFEEYEEVEGVKIPMRLETRLVNIRQIMTIEEVSHEPIDDEVYALPDAIRRLVEARQAEDAGEDADADADADDDPKP